MRQIFFTAAASFLFAASAFAEANPNDKADLKIGAVSKEFVDGCGCDFVAAPGQKIDNKQDDGNTIFVKTYAEGPGKGWINIAGKTTELKMTKDTSRSKSESSKSFEKGHSYQQEFSEGDLCVKFNFVITAYSYEGESLSGEMVVQKGQLVKKMKVAGGCGC